MSSRPVVLLQEFVPVAKELESGNWTHFTPHFILWVCPETYRRTEECKAQCIHGGRYCTPDPDGDIQQGYSGKEIVQVSWLTLKNTACTSFED